MQGSKSFPYQHPVLCWMCCVPGRTSRKLPSESMTHPAVVHGVYFQCGVQKVINHAFLHSLEHPAMIPRIRTECLGWQILFLCLGTCRTTPWGEYPRGTLPSDPTPKGMAHPPVCLHATRKKELELFVSCRRSISLKHVDELLPWNSEDNIYPPGTPE